MARRLDVSSCYRSKVRIEFWPTTMAQLWHSPRPSQRIPLARRRPVSPGPICCAESGISTRFVARTCGDRMQPVAVIQNPAEAERYQKTHRPVHPDP